MNEFVSKSELLQIRKDDRHGILIFMTNMIPALEVTILVPSFSQESYTYKRAGTGSFGNCTQSSAVRPSLTKDWLFVWEFIDLMISSKDIFASQRLNYLLDIFSLSGILLKNSVVEAWKVVSFV